MVALESTIISHGFQYPDNLEMATKCEDIVRKERAIPATIGIVGGEIVIGLDENEIEHFAQNNQIEKCSRKDVPSIIAAKKDGATTVATTMMFAKMAGIKVFATGGIGGVHFDGKNTLDISADLEELAQTNVAVVCSGAKLILDIPKTLEYLETKGVSVIGYQTDQFPDFYTRDSGEKVERRYDDLTELASMLQVKNDLKIESGVVIANPIPKSNALDPIYTRTLIQDKKEGIKGNKVTPFLLARLHYESEGKTVDANHELVLNNAKVAAQFAKAWSSL